MKKYGNVNKEKDEIRDENQEENQGENQDIGIKEIFKTLSLFFVLTVITLLLISGKFRQGVEDFWENNEKASETIEKMGWDELFEA